MRWGEFDLSDDAILKASDSLEPYQPAGFDHRLELAHAARLAKALTRHTDLRTEIDDPSGFQDGALFTRILLFGPQGELPGQVLLSSFGSLVTTDQVTDAKLAGQIALASTENGYIHLSRDILLKDYDGTFGRFRDMTWFMRFFNAFHVRLRRR